MKDIEIAAEGKRQAVQGGINTIAFIVFAVMHISLALTQYNVADMVRFNHAITKSLFPGIDIYKPVTPR